MKNKIISILTFIACSTLCDPTGFQHRTQLKIQVLITPCRNPVKVVRKLLHPYHDLNLHYPSQF